MATLRKRGCRWQVQIRRKDAPHISRSFASKRDAAAWARQMEVDADRKHLRADPRELEKIRLSDLVKRYRDTVTPTKKGFEREVYVLNAFLRHPICSIPLSRIQPSDFAAYRDERLKTIAPDSLNRQLTPLQHLFEVAVTEWGIPLQSNPLKLIRRPRNAQGRDRRLASGEYEKLVREAAKSRNRYFRPIIIIAVETGMRRSEILNLRLKDIDIERKQLRIRTSKNGQARSVPLSPRGFEAVASILSPDNDAEAFLFPITPNSLRQGWEHIRLRAGCPDLHFHDLRHEAISRLFEAGLGIAEVATIAGHNDFRMLARYTHVKAVHLPPEPTS